MLASLHKIWLFSAFLTAVALSQSIEDEFNNPCKSLTTCGQCIQTSRLCAWCGAENFPRDFTRCDLLEPLKRNCKESDIFNPETSKKTDKDDTYTSGGPSKPPVQVKPQVMTFNIRPNDPVDFKLHFRQQSNYPVDLYFLLDLSFGMVRQKAAQDRLIALGQDITTQMVQITNNFKLGFGTFVDKTLMPYSAWTETMLANRCPLEDKKCRTPHDFRNQVNLGENYKEFANKMESALKDVSQSLDDAEGGLDGLIQALDCKSIGWRDVSRRIIVYSSNSIFHLAGNGKLGGATKQSDLTCDLSDTGLYQGEQIYDYPSVSQIADKLREKNANVIFAVMSNVTKHYKLLENFLDGAVVGELAENSKNIVELIASKYYELRSQIQFQPLNADDVKITLKSKCRGDVMKETDRCENLEINHEVVFDVNLVVSNDVCEGKEGSVVKKQVLLSAVGLNEQLVMNLNVKCECQCETEDAEVLNSDKCNNNGTLECGICNCNEGRYGKKCECDETNISSEESLKECRRGNESAVCAGNGECICGSCHCFPIPNDAKGNLYDGNYCECNHFNCPIGKDRKMCSGQGSCRCGKCECNEGWSGVTCDCSTDNTTCIASNGKLCNSFGDCVCGKCICSAGTDKFGPTCEGCNEIDCPTYCNSHRDCALCKAHQTGPYDIDECEAKCTTTRVENSLPPQKNGVTHCKGTDGQGCTFHFSYLYGANNVVDVVSQRTKSCPSKANIEAIIGGTVAAVVVIPLLIICLIILIRNRRDAKEYADFMREREKAQWDATSNPIYKDPKSTFQNPTYKGGKK